MIPMPVIDRTPLHTFTPTSTTPFSPLPAPIADGDIDDGNDGAGDENAEDANASAAPPQFGRCVNAVLSIHVH